MTPSYYRGIIRVASFSRRFFRKKRFYVFYSKLCNRQILNLVKKWFKEVLLLYPNSTASSPIFPIVERRFFFQNSSTCSDKKPYFSSFLRIVTFCSHSTLNLLFLVMNSLRIQIREVFAYFTGIVQSTSIRERRKR